MQKKRNLLTTVVIALLIAVGLLPITALSKEADATTTGAEEDEDLEETNRNSREEGNDTSEEAESEGGEYTSSFRAEDCNLRQRGEIHSLCLNPTIN